MSDPEFDKMLEDIMSDNTRTGRVGFKVAPGPSITDLIHAEILASPPGNYRIGLKRALYTIDEANRDGRKPFYALGRLYGIVAAEGNSEVTRGVKTVQFIFTTPYKWIAGERP